MSNRRKGLSAMSQVERAGPGGVVARTGAGRTAANETPRDRSPVAAAPHAEGCLVELDVLMRAGPLRAGTARAPAMRRSQTWLSTPKLAQSNSARRDCRRFAAP